MDYVTILYNAQFKGLGSLYIDKYVPKNTRLQIGKTVLKVLDCVNTTDKFLITVKTEENYINILQVGQKLFYKDVPYKVNKKYLYHKNIPLIATYVGTTLIELRTFEGVIYQCDHSELTEKIKVKPNLANNYQSKLRKQKYDYELRIAELEAKQFSNDKAKYKKFKNINKPVITDKPVAYDLKKKVIKFINLIEYKTMDECVALNTVSIHDYLDEEHEIISKMIELDLLGKKILANYLHDKWIKKFSNGK